MKKNPSVLIAVLTLTAIVLGVILIATPSRHAEAAMLANEANVVMMTSSQPQSGDESLIIFDKGTGKMLLYRIDGNQLTLNSGADIAAIFNRAPAR